MSFSDEDLKRLKESIKTNQYTVTLQDKMYALLARLEAAEKMTQAIECHDLWTEYKEWIPKLVEAYDLWRKAAGK